MSALDRVLVDAAAHLCDLSVWVASAVAVALLAVSVASGGFVAVRVGFISPNAPRSTYFSVSLGTGLLLIITTYAALRSIGGSTFTPAAIALFIAAALGRKRPVLPPLTGSFLLSVVAAMALLLVLGAVFGLTLAPGPRDGSQPVEFMDAAYYSVLGAQLHETGIENVYGPSGVDIPGVTARSWYHWGELWLSAIALEIPGVSPIRALHQVALPLILLTAACLLGSLAQRYAAVARGYSGFFLGAFGLLTVGPIPLHQGDFFDWWARSAGFTVTQYGLAFVVVLLGLHLILDRWRDHSLSYALATGGVASAMVASHALVAAAAVVGLTAAALLRLRVHSHGTAPLSKALGRDLLIVMACIGTTIWWGVLSGYGVGGGGAMTGIQAFDSAWWRAMLFALLGSGVLVGGIVVARMHHHAEPTLTALALGSVAAIVFGALAWGILLPQFNAFHAFYGPVAVVLTPIAILSYLVWLFRLQAGGRRLVASLGLAVFLAQGAVGIGATVQRLYEFGPGRYDPVPLTALRMIEALPDDAKLAYACGPFEEAAVWIPGLISITAHTDKSVVPLCFQADFFGPQLGVAADATVPSPFFALAPQHELYPTFDSRPRTSAILTFLQRHRVEFIYEDADHPNVLIEDLAVVHREGSVTIYRVP